jgi:hypothetical protein
MTQFVAASVIDAGLTTIGANSNSLFVCSAAPASFSQIQTWALASDSISAADFTVAAIGNSRTATLSARLDLTVTAAGIATHIVLANTNTQNILLVSACAPQALSVGDRLSISPLTISASISQTLLY